MSGRREVFSRETPLRQIPPSPCNRTTGLSLVSPPSLPCLPSPPSSPRPISPSNPFNSKVHILDEI